MTAQHSTGIGPHNALISQADIDAIKAANPILDIVQEHVSLRRSGSSWKGLCPFHSEKTPSLNVNPATGTFHCFGCGVGGDVIEFVQAIGKGESFRYAALTLADRAKITLSYGTGEDSDARATRTRALEAVAAAAEFYQDRLLSSRDATPARALLAQRKFTQQHAIDFDCGYAPDGPTTLIRHLHDQGFSDEELETSGLAVRTLRGGLRDFFQRRLTWTIRSEFGRPIGFGARRLHDNDPINGKFINTPETPVYRKSEVLYGFYTARKPILETHQAVIVEGYTDVMAAHIAGVTNAVASCGTAFTKEHLRLLRRSVGETGELIFAFDDDPAGHKASMAVYDLARRDITRLSTLGPTGGLDPDELRQTHGDDALAAAVERRAPLLGTVIRTALADRPTGTPEDKVTAIDVAAEFLSHATDDLIRRQYAEEVATLVGVAPGDVLARVRGANPQPSVQLELSDDEPVATRYEKELLRTLAQSPEAADLFGAVAPDLLQSDTYLPVAVAIAQALAAPPGPAWFDRVMAAADPSTGTVLRTLVAEGLPVPESRAIDYATECIDRLDQAAAEARKAQLRKQMESSDPQIRDSALKEFLRAVSQKDW